MPPTTNKNRIAIGISFFKEEIFSLKLILTITLGIALGSIFPIIKSVIISSMPTNNPGIIPAISVLPTESPVIIQRKTIGTLGGIRTARVEAAEIQAKLIL